jgi:uncharacterized membrane protein
VTERRGSVRGLALLFGVAGVAHFVVPGVFEAIVPTWVSNAPLAVQLSGVAELLGAVGLLLPATRVVAAWGLIALLVAVFPANVQMLLNARAAGASAVYVAMLMVRLPLQPLLIWWVWRAGVVSSR